MKQQSSFSNTLIVITVILFFTACTSPEKEKVNDLVEANKKAAQLNIDPVKVSPDKFKIIMENEHVRVVQYSLKPGEKDNWHTHPPKSSYVISGGKLKIHLENGDSLLVDEKTGTASWMNYLGKHFAENIGSTVVTILLTEIK